jgi:DNA-binding Lrp family transcriptional regulator
MQDPLLDDRDQRLIHAVQIAPRTPWTTLSPIVGADPVTLARRWSRLEQEGVVYTTGYGIGRAAQLALIEIECTPGETLAVAGQLTADREAVTVDITAGGRDVIVTLGTTDTAALGRWTLERLQDVAGIRAIRTHLVSELVSDARSWRLRALSRSEVEEIEHATVAPAIASPRLNDDESQRLSDALSLNGLASVSHISQVTGISPRRVRDAIAALRASGQLAIRVDVARARTPWPVYAWYFLRVPAAMVAQVGPQLRRLEEVRLVATAVGEYNVIMAVWLRTLQDVGRLEAIIEERLPGVSIADRSVVLRTVKHLGHLLDARGYATGEGVALP